MSYGKFFSIIILVAFFIGSPTVCLEVELSKKIEVMAEKSKVILKELGSRDRLNQGNFNYIIHAGVRG